MSDEPKTITLKIQYDESCENPLTSCDGMWTLYTDRDLDNFFTDRGGRSRYKWVPDTIDLFFKLRNGLAFTCGGWFHAGSSGTHAWVQDFDPADKMCGLLVWENPVDDMGAKTYEDRKKDAKSTLKMYEDWANGDCYGWIINDDEPDEDSCWGYVGEEDVREAVIGDYLPDERPLRVILVDDTTEFIMGSALDALDGVETLTRKEWREMEQAYMRLAETEADEFADGERLEMIA